MQDLITLTGRRVDNGLQDTANVRAKINGAYGGSGLINDWLGRQFIDDPLRQLGSDSEYMIGPSTCRPPDDVPAVAARIDADREFARTVAQAPGMLKEEMESAGLRAMLPRLGQIWRVAL